MHITHHYIYVEITPIDVNLYLVLSIVQLGMVTHDMIDMYSQKQKPKFIFAWDANTHLEKQETIWQNNNENNTNKRQFFHNPFAYRIYTLQTIEVQSINVNNKHDTMTINATINHITIISDKFDEYLIEHLLDIARIYIGSIDKQRIFPIFWDANM